MKTSLKTGFAQIFPCCPKKAKLPKIWGGLQPPSPPPAHTPMIIYLINITFPCRWDRISLRRSVFHRDCIMPKATEYAVSSTFPCRLATNRADWLGYSDARGDTTTATWPEKVVTEAIDHRMLNWLNKRFAIASQQTSVYVALLL